jgi:prepilin-type N-terminal cleavage/methylation domain-containing protein
VFLCPRAGKQGFTLVELIVVIVILGILAAIAVPALTGYIEKAEQSKLLAMAKEATTAAQSILSENSMNRVLEHNVNSGDDWLFFYDSDGNYSLYVGRDLDGDGIYEGNVEEGDYEYDNSDDPSTYKGISGFDGEMWKLTQIPMRVCGDADPTFTYVAVTAQGQIVAYLMHDPHRSIWFDGDGRMIGYNVSLDTNYKWVDITPDVVYPSYDPNAGFSYWKTKDVTHIEPW